MNCTACGIANEGAAHFCANCGKPLVQAPAQADEPAAPAPKPFNPLAATALMGSSQAQAAQAAAMAAAAAAAAAHAQPPPQMAGAPQPVQPGQAGQYPPLTHTGGPPFCADCGALMVEGKCLRCGGARAISAPAPTQGIHWVQLRLSIKCMTCQRPSPLQRLDMEGRFFCYGCGREQFFDPDILKENIFFVSSALGDCLWAYAGVFPPWPTNIPSSDFLEEHSDTVGGEVDVLPHVFTKCAEMGRTSGGMTIERGGMSIGSAGMRTRGLAVSMSPGHPLCAQCKAPLAIQVPSDGVVTTSCSRCGAQDSYAAPPAVKAACPDFCGVISVEHVQGREMARVTTQPGTAAIAVSCPKCGSGLQLAPGARITNCPYCKTTSVIPEHVAAAGAAPGAAEPFWLGFRAPSTIRKLMQLGATAASSASASSSSSSRPPDPAPGDEHAARRAEAELRVEEARAKASKTARIMSVVGIAVPAAIALSVFEYSSYRHKESAERAKTEGEHATSGTGATTTGPKPKPPPAYAVSIPSCSCAFGDGQSTPRITLQLKAPPTDGSKPWSLGIERQSGFISESTTMKLPPKPGAVLPPASGETAPLRLAMACAPGMVVVVAGNRATGWSSVNGAWKWNATLPAASSGTADAGVTATEGTDYTGTCSTELSVSNGVASVPLVNGKKASLSLKDGKVR